MVSEKQAQEALRTYAEKVIKFRQSFYFENMKMTENELKERFFGLLANLIRIKSQKKRQSTPALTRLSSPLELNWALADREFIGYRKAK